MGERRAPPFAACGTARARGGLRARPTGLGINPEDRAFALDDEIDRSSRDQKGAVDEVAGGSEPRRDLHEKGVVRRFGRDALSRFFDSRRYREARLPAGSSEGSREAKIV